MSWFGVVFCYLGICIGMNIPYFGMEYHHDNVSSAEIPDLMSIHSSMLLKQIESMEHKWLPNMDNNEYNGSKEHESVNIRIMWIIFGLIVFSCILVVLVWITTVIIMKICNDRNDIKVMMDESYLSDVDISSDDSDSARLDMIINTYVKPPKITQ